MPKRKDNDRENRIEMEIVADAHDSEERAMGWYSYLEDQLAFPFTARCIANRATSPLKVGDEVEVIEMAPQDECEREIFVMMRWERQPLAVPLSQLKPARATDEPTRQAVEDWHYWVKQGCEF